MAPADAARVLRTPRLLLRPVAEEHRPDLVALKSDPAAFGAMLGGARGAARAEAELAEDRAYWDARGYGIWAVHAAGDGAFLGIAGLMDHPDVGAVALRFALRPETRGRGLAREAARAVLAHGRAAGLARIVAVAGEDNAASRAVLADVGMQEVGRFPRDGRTMLVHEWTAPGGEG